jgi:hypothetical protein
VCREVIALEERMLHLLHSVPQGDCNWMVKSRDRMKFMLLDDSLLDELARKPSLSMEVRMVEGMKGGWRAVGTPWIVPEALLSSRTVSCLKNQVCTTYSTFATASTCFVHVLTPCATLKHNLNCIVLPAC